MFGLGNSRKAKQRFQRTYNEDDFMSSATLTAVAGQWNTIGTITVPAQQEVTFGYGGSAPTDTRGSAYLKINLGGANPATTDFIAGKIRLSLTDANQLNEVVVMEERTERFSADTSDRTKALMVGEFRTRAREDSKLLIKYYPDSATNQTLYRDGTSSQILLPVTVYQ